MSRARRGLRKTWRWPTDGFSASRPAREQRLADVLRERAVVAREAAREVGEVGVVAAPLAHARRGAGGSAARRGAPGSGSSCGRAAPRARRAGRARPPRAPRPTPASAGRPPRPRDGLGDAQRVRGADRLAQARRVAEHAAGHARAPAPAAGRCRRRAPRRRAARTPRARRARPRRRDSRAARGPRSRRRAARGRRRSPGGPGGELDERADGGGDEQPVALADRLGVGAQRGARRGGGEQPPSCGGERDRDRGVRSPSAACRARRRRGAAPSASSSRRRGGGWRRGGHPRRRRREARTRGSLGERRVERGLAASPWTAKTTRSSCEPPSRWRGTSSTSTRAASSSGKRPTPVPNATSARLRAPRRSARQRGGGRVADDLLRGRAAEVHGRGVDDPAAGMSPRGRLDRLAEPDRRLVVRFLLYRRATRAGDRAGYAAAVREIGVRGVRDRVDLERGDVGVEDLDRRHRLPYPHGGP